MSRNTLRALTLPARQSRANVAGTLRVPSANCRTGVQTANKTGAPRPAPRAFTLVELLVVITIIAILAALLVVGATAAMNRARFARIKLDVDNVSQAFEQYKNEVSGGDYPPSLMTDGSSGINNIVVNDVIRHFKKCFPRHREPEALLRRIAGMNATGSGDGTGSALPGGLTPGEAVVFWLGGFSSDPKYPISGTGGPSFPTSDIEDFSTRNKVYDFETTRLGAGEGIPIKEVDSSFNRFLVYTILGQERRINFWQYYPPGSTQPLVYFDASRRAVDVEPTLINGYDIHAIKQLKPGSTDIIPANIRYANDGKFQILHAGLDDSWGAKPGSTDPGFHQMYVDFSSSNPIPNLLLYPTGPFTLELADTVTNFTTGTLEDAQP